MPACQALWQRHLFAGATLGLLLSGASMLRGGGSEPLGSQALVLAVIFSTALAALLLSTVGASVFGVAHSFARTRPVAGRAAAAASTMVAMIYVALRGGAEAFRASSGAPFNLGTLEFILGGFGQLAAPILVEYAPLALGLGVLVLLMGVGGYFFLSRVGAVTGSSWGFLLRAGGSGAVFLLLIQALTTPGLASEGGLNRTADLMFLASIAARLEDEQMMLENTERLGAEVPRGPRISTGNLWQKAVGHLEGPRPNVVIVMMESVGVKHLGYFGYTRATTPHLDRIASKSLNFTNARSTAAHSNYAQMAVLSSLFPRRFSGLDTYKRLDYPRVLWHDFLDALNYSTATHSSQDETWQGMLRFQTTDTSTEFHHSGTYEGQRVRMGSESIVPDQVTVSRAIDWMDRAEGPFGLYVNLQATHFPYRTPAGVPAKYQPTRPTKGKFHYLGYPESDVTVVKNRYDNALTYIDQQIGRLYEFLEKSGRLDDTIFVVTSDHGELFWDHGMVTHGRSLFEEEVRVPLLLHYPPALSPRAEERSVSTLDVLPTISDLLQVPPHPAFQGTSLLVDEGNAPRPVFMNIQGMKSIDGLVCGRYKFVRNKSLGQDQLFDLAADPEERHNLLGELPEIAEKLGTVLRAQIREQMRYHEPARTKLRTSHYAPRMAACPALNPEPVASRSDMRALNSSTR